MSSLEMYNAMQPSVHLMIKNHIVVPSKNTKRNRKGYITVHIRPPTQLINKWYFQADFAKVPLVMFRTSATTLDTFYLGADRKSTNITITALNTDLFRNRQFKNIQQNGYYAKFSGTLKVYLYSSKETNINNIKPSNIIFLGNTKENVVGLSQQDSGKDKDYYKENSRGYWGNPFHQQYLSGDEPMYQSTETWASILNKLKVSPEQKIDGLTQVYPLWSVRYSPFKDSGEHNKCYFKSAVKDETDWDEPTDTSLINEGLPLPILLYGFADYIKKTTNLIRVDTEQILTIKTTTTTPTRNILVPINWSWTQGYSPYEERANPIDFDRWFPSFQYQQEAYNDICSCAPGTPNISKTNTVQAKLKYYFYFKWGGNPPPMSTIEDPKNQQTYPLPSNFNSTNSLQNPATAPETILHSFDERRSQITRKAEKRIKQDWEPKKHSLLSTDQYSRFAEITQTQSPETSETSSEEEEKEDNLYRLLQLQRNKQQRLKQRILRTITKLKNLE